MDFKECMAVTQRPPPTTKTTTTNMHDGEHGIKKLKPAIRIVHVIAPEIIKTDAANFREVVQKLTGKPETRIGNSSNRKKKKKKKQKAVCMASEGEVDPIRCKQVEYFGYGGGVKRELRMEMNSDGFSGEFGEIDGFLRELIDLPL